MIPTIINQFNVIRKMEHEKLLLSLQYVFQSTGKKNKQSISKQIVDKLIQSYENLPLDINDEIEIKNHWKLWSLLTLMIKNQKNTQEHLHLLSENNQNHTEILADSIRILSADIEKVNENLKFFIPENFHSKPLNPFIFTNETAEIKNSISIIIINDTSSENLKNLFDSFLRFNTFKKFKFIIVDQLSDNENLEFIRSYKNRIPFEIIKPISKTTFSYLNNLGADASNSEFLLFLNSKVIFESDVLTQFVEIFKQDISLGLGGAMIDIAEQHNTGQKRFQGGVKFKITEVKGTPDIPYPLHDPAILTKNGITTSLRDYRSSKRVFIRPKIFFTGLKPIPCSYPVLNENLMVPALLGTALFCRKQHFIETGGFDLNYYNGFEVTDLCLKSANKHFKKNFLAGNIILKVSENSIFGSLDSENEIINNYNLGVLLDKHGYFIKTKYLNSIIHKNNIWTDDEVEDLTKTERLVNNIKASLSIDQSIKNELTNTEVVSNYLSTHAKNVLRISIKIPAFDDDNVKFWGDYHFAHSLKRALDKKGFPTRVDLYDYWYSRGFMTDDVVIVLRGIKNYHVRNSQINIMWNISHPEHLSDEEYMQYDHVFVASTKIENESSDLNGIVTEPLLQCTDSELFNLELVSAKKNTDILIIANSRGILRKSVDYIIQKDIKASIYGTKWESILPPEMIKGGFIKNTDLRKYYSGCKILLNDHWQDMADEGYISNRIFDALACGAVILTDRVKGIEEVFPEGLFYYDTPDEMAEQIAWIREHYEEAKAMAIKNSREVLEKHTFDHRAERILEVIMQIHERKTSFIPPEPAKKPGFFKKLIQQIKS